MQGDKFVFIAECPGKKQERREEENDDSYFFDEEEFKYNSSEEYGKQFGETYGSLKNPVIVVYDMTVKDPFEGVNYFSVNDMKDEKYKEIHMLPAHPWFTESGNQLVYMTYDHILGNMGLVSWINRKTRIFMMQISKEGKLDGEWKLNEGKSLWLDEDYYFAGFPKFSPNYKYLVYFAVKDPFITHATSFELVKIKGCHINQGKKPFEKKVIIQRGEERRNFSGLFGDHDRLSEAKFIKNTNKMIFNSVHHGVLYCLWIDVEKETTGIIENPNKEEGANLKVWDIFDEYLLAESSSFKSQCIYLFSDFDLKDPIPMKIYEHAPVKTAENSEVYEPLRQTIESITIDTCKEYRKGFSLNGEEVSLPKVMKKTLKQDEELNEETKSYGKKVEQTENHKEDIEYRSFVNSEAYFVWASNEDIGPKPTIVMLHGGPNSYTLK